MIKEIVIPGLILLIVVGGVLLAWSLARMAAPYGDKEQAANDDEQMEDLRLQAEERARRSQR